LKNIIKQKQFVISKKQLMLQVLFPVAAAVFSVDKERREIRRLCLQYLLQTWISLG
jgi:hypothetical protein